jgi:hypothetical protein
MQRAKQIGIGNVLLLYLAVAMPCCAQQPAAIVEAVHAAAAGVQIFDFVSAGQIIPLGVDGRITLGYLSSCERERIEGGRVTVGQTQSTDDGGSIKRLKVACDGGALQLTQQAVQQSAVVVFRAGTTPSKDLPKAQIVLFGTSPVVKLAGVAATLEIQRLDHPAQTVSLAMAHPTEDLARLGIALAPGGLYIAKAQGRGIVFKIDPAASAGAGPVVGRLLHF